ncbi:uncharacterized protein HMPREF1541_04968 [Cyphellophora europaea CBS 101466]|uniref:DUF1770 domain-containing protein n=1 Tax=Cyphellophora europaea (strain CBS 101466) TaxID=1220924 RepID=W2RYD2_CYPE1|nr:uncharacterized protein HMPREF1541_04968 [Cyphellophora europaea CBS 101466]ETN40689.1 hypothetical protein HMPREF1541_04968 [Cyphellophora europaea CBS 101466]
MASNPAAELASTIQAAHIVRNPSPTHDVNPSTAASDLVPADVHSPDLSDAEDDASTIPSDIVRPTPRSRQKAFPPLPDMRFEQSYLASIENAETKTQVAIITIRDQILLPLLQGTLWNFVLFGWRHWNRGAKFQGESIGAKVRKWWWGVNNWKVPKLKNGKAEFAKGAEDFYVDRFGTSLGD